MVTCLHPQRVYNKYLGTYLSVPCGHCESCLQLKQGQWSNRCFCESKVHSYCYFVTLTYMDEFLPVVDLSALVTDGDFVPSKTFYQSVEQSREYIQKCNYLIPCCSTSDIQRFFKRFRINLIRFYNVPKEQATIRYFCAFEYGPTTYRPHYHCLVWFDSPAIAQHIEECVFKSWKCKCPHKSLSSFLERNCVQRVFTGAESYVSGYVNSSVGLPPLLNEPPFRVKHLQSKSPSIGHGYFSKEQYESCFFGDSCEITFAKPKSFDVICSSLWRSVESRLFPKCPRFSVLLPYDRKQLYIFPTTALWKSFTSSDSLRLFLSDVRTKNTYYAILFRSVLDISGFAESDLSRYFTDVTLSSAVSRLYGFFKRVERVAAYFNVSVAFAYERIADYYTRKDYLSLYSQLEWQENYLAERDNPCHGLRYLPFLIDWQFYGNKRSLSYRAYQTILASYDLADVDCLDYLPFYNDFYRQRKGMVVSRFNEHSKSRKRKDYVANHPEFGDMYSNFKFMALTL